MADNHNGGNAFPNSFSSDYPTEITGGMTLRDYFAAKALPGVISAVMVHECHNWTSSAFAREAYELADAMLKARDA